MMARSWLRSSSMSAEPAGFASESYVPPPHGNVTSSLVGVALSNPVPMSDPEISDLLARANSSAVLAPLELDSELLLLDELLELALVVVVVAVFLPSSRVNAMAT